MLSMLLTIAGVHLAALASPGPDTFIVMQTAASRSRREAFFCVLGIAVGVAFWASLSLLGLHWLFEQFAWLHKILMGLGGTYLIWLGWEILRSALKKTGGGESSEIITPHSSTKAFRIGLFTNLANAKAIIYFSSVFALFIMPGMSAQTEIVIFLLIVIESFLWFSFVAVLLGLPKPKQIYHSSAKWIDGVCGIVFGAFGLALIYTALGLPSIR